MKVLASLLLLGLTLLVPSLARADQQAAIDAWTAADEVHAYAVAGSAQVNDKLTTVQQLRIDCVTAINQLTDLNLKNQLATEMFNLQPGYTFQTVSGLQGFVEQALYEGDELYYDGVDDYLLESYPAATSNFEDARDQYVYANDTSCWNLYSLEILETALSAILSQATGL